MGYCFEQSVMESAAKEGPILHRHKGVKGQHANQDAAEVGRGDREERREWRLCELSRIKGIR